MALDSKFCFVGHVALGHCFFLFGGRDPLALDAPTPQNKITQPHPGARWEFPASPAGARWEFPASPAGARWEFPGSAGVDRTPMVPLWLDPDRNTVGGSTLLQVKPS